MKKLLSLIIPSILLVGVLASCESTSPVIEEAQLNIYTQNFDSAYSALDRYINQNPDNGLGYYYKALANAEQAATVNPPSDRRPIYSDFRDNITTSRDLFGAMEETPDEAGDVTNLILNTWGREHNAAIQYATDDSVMATVDEPLKLAIDHLENAIVINPDSTLSYDVLSQIYYMDSNFENAATTLEESMALKDPAPAEDYDRISAYYGQSGQAEKAISILQEGLELYPDSVSLTQKLADNYMNAGEREKAIEVLEGLIENDPNNAQYRLVLGTVILSITENSTTAISDAYEQIYDLENQLRNASEEEAAEIEQEIANLEEEIADNTEDVDVLNNRAQKALEKTIEMRPNDEQAHNALGVLFQNKAALLFAERNNADDLDRVNELDAQAKDLLREAMGYYEKTVEINPDNTSAWRSLSNVYIQLDMQEKAQEAIEKAGM